VKLLAAGFKAWDAKLQTRLRDELEELNEVRSRRRRARFVVRRGSYVKPDVRARIEESTDARCEDRILSWWSRKEGGWGKHPRWVAWISLLESLCQKRENERRLTSHATCGRF